MTREEMKQRLRARGGLRPEDELSLSVAIDETIQTVWDAHDWSWKDGIDTFTTTGDATWELPVEVDAVLELTYGSKNRVVHHLPSHRVTELYDNISRSGSTVYYYRLYSTEPDQLTIELVPAPTSGTVFTYRYRRKLVEGDLSKIPSKMHPVVLLGAGVFMATSDLYSSPAFQGALARAIQRDKPISVRRWTMGIDELRVARIATRSTLMGGGSSGDTDHPID